MSFENNLLWTQAVALADNLHMDISHLEHLVTTPQITAITGWVRHVPEPLKAYWPQLDHNARIAVALMAMKLYQCSALQK